MEEKERYELTDTDCILDTERNIVVSDVCDVVANADIITELLNQQDKRIKELEEELDDAKRDYIPKLEFGLQRANKMGRDAEKEIQQLKQSQKQLAIGELRRIKEYILINDKYDEEVGCNIIETFDLLEDIRDRIEELSGGESE